MCDANNEKPTEDLPALAARFIAETNAFLNRFWADPSVRWPMQPPNGTVLGLQRCAASASPDRGAAPTPLAHSEHATLPDFDLQVNCRDASRAPVTIDCLCGLDFSNGVRS